MEELHQDLQLFFLGAYRSGVRFGSASAGSAERRPGPTSLLEDGKMATLSTCI